MLTLSPLHDIGRFTSREHSNMRYDVESHRLFATDGDVIISVPVDGNSVPSHVVSAKLLKQALDGKSPSISTSGKSKLKVGSASTELADEGFPNVLSAFPNGRSQIFIPLDPDSMAKVCEYAKKHRGDGEQVWLSINPKGTGEFIQPDGGVMFFFVADDPGGRKLVSGVIAACDIEDEAERQKVIGRAAVARKPREHANTPAESIPDHDPQLEKAMKFLKQRGYTIFEPGREPSLTESSGSTTTTRRRGSAKGPRLSEVLRAISSENDARLAEISAADFDFSERDRQGNSPMIHAARFGTPKMIALIAQKCPSIVDAPDSNGVWTPIMHAIDAGKTENAKALLKCGAHFSEESREEMGDDYTEAIQAVLA